MPASTKIVLALIVLLLVVLGLYYGLVSGDVEPFDPDRPDEVALNVGDAVGSDRDELIPTDPAPGRTRGTIPGSLRDAENRPSPPPLTNVPEPSSDADVDDIDPIVGPRPGPDRVEDDMPDFNLGDINIDNGKDGPPAQPEDVGASDADTDADGADDASDEAVDSDASDVEDPPADDPPAPRPAVTPPPAYTDYTVRENDNLWTIAAQWFGDASKWDLIARANPSVDPQHLRVGMVLRLPPRDTEREEPDVEPARTGSVEYTVRSGDTLSKIAHRYYGSAAQWPLIFSANRDTIGEFPENLRVGMKIIIPPAPAPAEPPPHPPAGPRATGGDA